MNLITAGRVCVPTPLLSVSTTQLAFIEVPFVKNHHLPKILRQKAKAANKVTLKPPTNLLLLLFIFVVVSFVTRLVFLSYKHEPSFVGVY